MNKNQQLYQWLKAKSKRNSTVARQIGVAKQYISEVHIVVQGYQIGGLSFRTLWRVLRK